MKNEYIPTGTTIDDKDIPKGIIQAAQKIAKWVESKSAKPNSVWALGPVCSRNHADEVNRLRDECVAVQAVARAMVLKFSNSTSKPSITVNQGYFAKSVDSRLLVNDDNGNVRVSVEKESNGELQRLIVPAQGSSN